MTLGIAATFLLLPSFVFPDTNFSKYCSDAYEKDQQCPSDVCRLKPEGCVPKPCYAIDVASCPKDYCDILKGCSGKKVCYDKIDDSLLMCGGLAYEGQTLECCEGFVKRCGIEFYDGSCDMEGKNTSESVAACIPCGNGICNQFENRCNCPEDCGQFELKDRPKQKKVIPAVGEPSKGLTVQPKNP
ncbi:MAG: DUF2180 family protein [Candidatus Omnitrophica bacterium]|nr:DUF2180 family protein [Candidatus Omnitrophota bacterium]